MHLFIATSNAGKLRDFVHAAQTFPQVVIEPLPNIAAIPAPEEDADSFEGNATLKAVAYSFAAPGALVLADDSGIEVDALGGAPGVRSARYADDRHFSTNRPLPIDQRNNLCLLDALSSTREDQRTGRYRCVLAMARDGVVLATASGSVEGEILAVPRGAGGFGYDPLFLLPDEGVTMAEIDAETRLRVSHRGRALVALLEGMTKENLTGVWEANLLQSKILGPVPRAITVTIAHAGPELQQEMVVTKLDGSDERIAFQCRTDGEPGNNLLNGRAVGGSARWEGKELVIELRMQAGTRELVFRDYWSLSADGRRLSMEHRDDDLAGQVTVFDRVG